MSSNWRFIVSGLPALGVAALAVGALQGDPDVLRVPAVYEVLAGAGAIGWLVAWLSVRALRAAPPVPIAQAQPGRVSLQGKAQWPPGRRPLVSPAGRPCVWFHYRERDTLAGSGLGKQDTSSRNHRIYESTHPFLIVDGSGQCIVVPAGAEITGGNLDESIGHRETAIFAGDDIAVYGQWRPFSPDALPPEGNDDKLPSSGARHTVSVHRTVSRNADGSSMVNEVSTVVENGKVQTHTATRPLAKGEAEGGLSDILAVLHDPARKSARALPEASAPALQPPFPTLPTIGRPDGFGLYVITTHSLESAGGLFGLLQYVNLGIVLVSAGALAWLHTATR